MTRMVRMVFAFGGRMAGARSMAFGLSPTTPVRSGSTATPLVAIADALILTAPTV
jgi:hypothetical protein